MRRINGRVVALIATGTLVLVSVACTPTGRGGPTGQGPELVKNKCTVCHTIDRINKASKNRAGWEKTVARMRVHGAVITDAEAAQIADFLSQSGAGK